MIKLGMVYGLDLLFNNSDRLPLSVWNNKGDINHFMVKAETSYTHTTSELFDRDNIDLDFEVNHKIKTRCFTFLIINVVTI